MTAAGGLVLFDGSAPSNPPSGYELLYFNGGTLFSLNSAGVSSPIGSGSTVAMTRNTTATLGAGEETVFTGSTAAQTLTLPGSTALNGTNNTVANLASVTVTLAPGSGTTLNNFGAVGNITVPVNAGFEVELIGTVWYVLEATYTRITRRYVTVTQSATPTVNTDITDTASITGLNQAITSMTTNLSGTPVGGDQLIFEITDNGTARAITWGASFEASTVALPTTTVISAKLSVGFIWNVATTKWRCVAVA
jgi:hypothetical protein